MQKTIYLLPNRLTCLLIAFLFIMFACSDDDRPKEIRVIDEDLEGTIAWEFVNVGLATHEGGVVSSVSASSSHSLSTTSSGAVSSGFSFWRLTMGLHPSTIPVGSSLELSVKVKVTDVTGDGVFVALRGDGDSSSSSIFFETTQDVQTISGTADFATYTVNLDSYPEGVKYIYIFLIMHGSSTGSANFDDITLTSHH